MNALRKAFYNKQWKVFGVSPIETPCEPRRANARRGQGKPGRPLFFRGGHNLLERARNGLFQVTFTDRLTQDNGPALFVPRG